MNEHTSPLEAWNKCTRPDWLFWFINAMVGERTDAYGNDVTFRYRYASRQIKNANGTPVLRNGFNVYERAELSPLGELSSAYDYTTGTKAQQRAACVLIRALIACPDPRA